jgi:hypothetical protein
MTRTYDRQYTTFILMTLDELKVNFCGSTNPQYDKRLFIDLPVHYMKTTSSENVKLCTQIVCFFWHSEQFMYSHLSNKRGGWNKCGGWDFMEKTNA